MTKVTKTLWAKERIMAMSVQELEAERARSKTANDNNAMKQLRLRAGIIQKQNTEDWEGYGHFCCPLVVHCCCSCLFFGAREFYNITPLNRLCFFSFLSCFPPLFSFLSSVNHPCMKCLRTTNPAKF